MPNALGISHCDIAGESNEPRMQSVPTEGRIQAEVVSLEDSRWVWAEFLTSVALTGLCVAALFSKI